MLGNQFGRVSFASGAILGLERCFGLGNLSFWLSLVSDVLGPSVGRRCPRAIVLDAQVVDASNESESAVFSPVSAPGIPDNPIFDSVFLSPASHADIMVFFNSAGVVDEDASSVVPERVGDCERASDWSSLIDLVDHCSLALHSAELFHSVDLCPLLRPAALSGEAVLALDLIAAAHSVVVAECLIRRAGLVSDVVLVDPLVSVFGIASSAAVVVRAGDENLRSDIDVWPLSLSPDLDAIGESGSGGKGPARAAIDGNMLVTLHSEIVCAVDFAPPE